VLDVLPELCFMTADLPPAELPDLLRGERRDERKGEDGGNDIFGKVFSECDLGRVDATVAKKFSSERVLGSVESLVSPLSRGRAVKESRWADVSEIMSALSELKLLVNDLCSSLGPVPEGWRR